MRRRQAQHALCDDELGDGGLGLVNVAAEQRNVVEALLGVALQRQQGRSDLLERSAGQTHKPPRKNINTQVNTSNTAEQNWQASSGTHTYAVSSVMAWPILPSKSFKIASASSMRFCAADNTSSAR